MASTLTASYHTHRGDYFFKLGQWREAITEFSWAIWASAPDPNPEALIGRARAALRANAPLNETLSAFADARVHGFHDPQFWTLSIRYYLITIDNARDVRPSLSASSRKRLDALEQDVHNDIDFGVATFRRLLNSKQPQAFPWGAALVALADWMVTFQNPNRAEEAAEKHPFQALSRKLYQPVAASELVAIFADPDLQAEIEEDVTGHARRQLEALRTDPGDSSQPSTAWETWTIVALAAAGAIAILFVEPLLGALILIPALLLLLYVVRCR